MSATIEGRLVIREGLRPGDLGWVIGQHGRLYAETYAWDASFEALVAGIATAFAERHDPNRERCWIAEIDGENVGCAFLVQQSAEVARLRLLLVVPAAQGHGIGRRLVRECIAFARLAGYRRITLWTQSILTAARHLYEEAGFTLVSQEPYHAFGATLTAETWELDLRATGAGQDRYLVRDPVNGG